MSNNRLELLIRWYLEICVRRGKENVSLLEKRTMSD